MIKMDYIKEYVELAKNLNFSRTADQLFITQPALSKHIAIIEENMGAKLFVRDTKSVSLTPSGQAVYAAFQDILDVYSHAQEQATFLSSGKTGKLSISSPYYWSEDYADPVIIYLAKTYPQLEIRLHSCQPIEGLLDILNNRSDIAIGISSSEINDNIRRYEFTTEKLCVVLSNDHPLAHRSSVRLEELETDTFVFLEADASKGTEANKVLSELVLDLMAKRGFTPKKSIFAQQVDTLGISILETGGISVMPYCLRNMKRNYIKTIPLEDPDCVLNMCFYYRIDNGNPTIPVFLQAVNKLFSKQFR